METDEVFNKQLLIDYSFDAMILPGGLKGA